MGQHGTMLDPDGEGSLGMAAVPASRGSSLNPFSPSKPSDRMGHRKRPSICPPRAWSLLGADRGGIEGLTKMVTQEGRVGSLKRDAN